MRARTCLSNLLLVASLATPALAWGAGTDAQGLDLTMQVLGKTDKVDDRLVNRIEVPGFAQGRAPNNSTRGSTRKEDAPATPPPPPTPQEYQAWVEQYREAQRERRLEAWERYRQWREQQRK